MNMQSLQVGSVRDFKAAAAMPLRAPLALGDVVLHHLRTPAEIADIVYLRDEIDLSAHTAAGRDSFERLEKKEMSAVSCSVSSSVASGSAPSASSRWGTN
jgi:hypothetical protein